MSGAMIAAAALGLAGSQATSFVLAPRTSSTTATASGALRGATRFAQKANVASASDAQAMVCSSVAAGTLLGAAAAVTQKRRSNRSCMGASLDASKELGAMAPCGYWDPCGLMKERVGVDGWQWKDEKTFEKYRVAERKHGRVAMLAATGLLVNVAWKFEGFGLVPQGVAALEDGQGGAGFGLLFIMAAYFELNYPKGDFPDPFNFGEMMDESMDSLREKELNNGRIGMFAAITLLMYDVFEKKPPSEMWYWSNLNSTTLPAILVLALVAVPVMSQIWSYDGTPAEIKAKLKAAEADSKAKLPEAKPVTIKAELPESAPPVAAKEDIKELSTSDADKPEESKGEQVLETVAQEAGEDSKDATK